MTRASKRARNRQVSRPAEAGSPRGARRSGLPAGFLGPAALIGCLGLLAYSNSFSIPFTRDDHVSVVGNSSIRDWTNWPSVLWPMREVPTAGRPIVNLSLAINYRIGGLEVAGYHVWNLTMHLVCAVLVFAIVRRTLMLPRLAGRFNSIAPEVSLAVASLWVVHPLNSEVVNYITQRSESMMAVFYLLTMFAAICAIDAPVGRPFGVSARLRASGASAWLAVARSHSARAEAAGPAVRRRSWQSIAVLSCALGMGCKESMATAPLAVVLYDRVFVFDSLKQAVRDRWRLYAALAATWIVLVALMWSGPRSRSVGFEAGIDPSTYLLNQAVMLSQYLRRAIWPQALVVNYGWPQALTIADVWWQGLLIAAIAIGTLVALVRWPPIGFLGGWFFLTLAPTSSIVPIATEVGAERRMYLPLIALVTLIVLAAFEVARRLPSLVVRLAMVTLVALLMIATLARNREYQSSVLLARTVVERWPTRVAHHVLGEELLGAGDRDEALIHLRAALPDVPRARFSLGMALLHAGQANEAIGHLQDFVREEPLSIEAPIARLTLARAFVQQQRWPLAIEQARLVLAMTPDRVEARLVLADALSGQESYAEAVTNYRAYLQSHPDDRDAHTNLGIALVATEQLDEALTAFRRAVEIAPDRQDARRNLAHALFDRGLIEEAVEQSERALKLDPRDRAMHVLLGRALALQDKFDQARLHFERALEIEPKDLEARTYLDRLRQLGRF